MQRPKLSKDLIWNYISMGIMAGGGLLFNITIGFYYDADVLGVFNIVYAYYIVLSQLCVGGIHMAVTKYCAQYADDEQSTSELLATASILTSVISICVAGMGGLLSNGVLAFLFSPNVLKSLNMVWPALIFFSLNKVFLGYLNGILAMKAYAFFQGMRNLLIVLAIVVLAVMGFPGYYITICFFIAETLLFGGGIVYLLSNHYFTVKITPKWMAPIFAFGIRILPANVVLELNTKVDILCMSWLLKDERIVGIYSFAVLFAEGFYQAMVVLRRMINPWITQWYEHNELEKRWEELKNRYSRFLLMGCAVVMLFACGIQYLFGAFLKGNDYRDGTLPLIIICMSIVLNRKSILLGNVLSQTGNPLEESIVNIVTVMTNIILNIIFINVFGMIGAAIATGLSYMVFNMVQHFLILKRLQIKL